jgi:2-polyprenyl-3-methyl-5-hydroxy-6-metoxy-1,4-benzoquinol methylase
MKCPLCESSKYKLLGETKLSRLFQCKKCKTNFIEKKIDYRYDDEYFSDTYQKAYGKTYQDDEKNIRNISRRRLEIIKNLLKASCEENLKLLDIGSALGFFCDEAKKSGFNPTGIEISEYARSFAKEKFGIPSYRDLDELQSNKDKFDCISLWFTLEHLENPLEVLYTLKKFLKKNGILALGLPNGNGAFFKFNRKGYLKARPVEHIFEPSIKGISKVLKSLGFKVEKLEIFGLHPERINLPANKFSCSLQRILKLGDTFEIYSRNVK